MSQHSRTAEYNALFRALESALSQKKRLFTDPMASRFLRPSLRAAAMAARLSPLNAAICRFIDRRWPGARTSAVARTRYIDEALTDALSNGLTRVVILGAGFDSRAYRIPGIANAHVFEVDHPDTSQTKQQIVSNVFAGRPPHVSFVSIDFNRQDLGAVMHSAGLDLDRPIFFIWEGVTNYLTDTAVEATFKFVATAAALSRIIFTYIHRDVLRPESTFHGAGSVRNLVSDVGEAWTFGFEPSELPEYLEGLGLHLISDINSTKYRARYMGNRARHLIGYEFYRIASAEVTKRGASTLLADSASISK
ncbi:MAG: SAM-dependent methyltransferase [Syntrophobacteraceae bacterium]